MLLQFLIKYIKDINKEEADILRNFKKNLINKSTLQLQMSPIYI